MSRRQLSVAFVLPYGETHDAFFPDTFLATLCAVAQNAGHRGEVVRVYYDGHDAAKDRTIAQRLEQWLDERAVDLVVAERLFDTEPIRKHVSRQAGRRCVLVSRGDSFDPIVGVDLAIGAIANATRSGRTKRTPTVSELTATFEHMLTALSLREDPTHIPGVSRFEDGQLVSGTSINAELAQNYHVPLPTLEQDVIVLDSPPPIIRKTLFGNSGCPYGDDSADNPHFKGIELEEGASISRLGCAFCFMGGDYQKRPDAEVVNSLVAQAKHLTQNNPLIEELVLTDQYPVRYLGSLIEQAHDAGVRPVRWLFAARCDAFIKEETRIRRAIEAAAKKGHLVETYLSGFESFCNEDLERYNKGINVADQLNAVSAMRQLATEFPNAFEYNRARGHSLIIWNPWSTPENLSESIQNMRRHGLSELFHDVGRNRLRLYNDLPITRAAERDGAVLDQWEDGDEGAGRKKGYNPERPWRFLDPRMRDAHNLAGQLRRRLGSTTEMSQLATVAAYCAAVHDLNPTTDSLMADVDALSEVIDSICDSQRKAPRHGWQERARAVLFGGQCNNACSGCSNLDTWFAESREALFQRVDKARTEKGPVLLAGREPTLHADFLDILSRARGDDERNVGLVTNGRRFAYSAFSVAALKAGLRSVSLKLFGASADIADHYCRDSGAFEQAVMGAKTLLNAGLPALELRVVLHRKLPAQIEELPQLAVQLGAAQLRVEVALDAVGLAHLKEARDAIATLRSECISQGLPLEMSPLSAGTRRFDWIPTPRMRD